MKKVIIVMLTAVLLIALSSSAALADPKWYNGPGGYDAKNLQTTPWSPFHRALATDGLIDVTGGSASGFVTFVCQSQEGFEHSVDVKGLMPGNTYSVSAEQLGPPGSPVYSLGSITTNGDGEGELQGVLSLAPGSYGFAIKVTDASGLVILSTPPDDAAGFTVFP